jgi:hypothetical protein
VDLVGLEASVFVFCCQMCFTAVLRRRIYSNLRMISYGNSKTIDDKVIPNALLSAM